MDCFVCENGTFEPRTGPVQSEYKGRKYAIEMSAEVCCACGYTLVPAPQMPELMRKLADAYRRDEKLLTSEEIKRLRARYGLSQQAFAKQLGVSPASLKRWELGKVQDRGYDNLMRSVAERLGPRYRFESNCPRSVLGQVAAMGTAASLAGLAGLANGPPPNLQ